MDGANEEAATRAGVTASENKLRVHNNKIADLVQKNLHGQRIAADFLDAIRTGKYVDPDSIFETIREIENDAELRGFCRILQKRIEQRRAYA